MMIQKLNLFNSEPSASSAASSSRGEKSDAGDFERLVDDAARRQSATIGSAERKGEAPIEAADDRPSKKNASKVEEEAQVEGADEVKAKSKSKVEIEEVDKTVEPTKTDVAMMEGVVTALPQAKMERVEVIGAAGELMMKEETSTRAKGETMGVKDVADQSGVKQPLMKQADRTIGAGVALSGGAWEESGGAAIEKSGSEPKVKDRATAESSTWKFGVDSSAERGETVVREPSGGKHESPVFNEREPVKWKSDLRTDAPVREATASAATTTQVSGDAGQNAGDSSGSARKDSEEGSRDARAGQNMESQIRAAGPVRVETSVRTDATLSDTTTVNTGVENVRGNTDQSTTPTTTMKVSQESGGSGGARPEPNEGDARVSEQAVRALRSVVNQRGGSVTLRLQPTELGSLRVRVEMSGGSVRAMFEASTESARSMLQHQIHTLRAALEGQGLSVDQLQVQTAAKAGGQHESAMNEGDDGRSRGSFDESGAKQGGTGEGEGKREERSKFERELLDLVA